MIVENENMLCVEGPEKPKQDAGAILEGSANVINAFGNIYGTWLMAKTGNTYTPPGSSIAGDVAPEDEDPTRKKRTITTVVIVGLSLTALGALLYFTLKKD